MSSAPGSIARSTGCSGRKVRNVRIIAGKAKGARLAPVPEGVRPVSDRAREGVFSSLAPEIPGARVLDLYAGTGAMGIEALSRGAEHATFVDRSRAAIEVIRDNLARTRLAERAEVAAADVVGFLTRTSNSRRSWDLVFVDPPYGGDPAELTVVLETLAAGPPPREGFTVVLTRSVKSSMPVIPVDWASARHLEYGDSLVVLYRSENREHRWA